MQELSLSPYCPQSIFNFPYAVTIIPLLCHLVLSIECWDIGASVAQCMRIKNPNVKKCILLPTPGSLCSNIQLCIIMLVGYVWQYDFAWKWLQLWYNNNYYYYYTNNVEMICQGQTSKHSTVKIQVHGCQNDAK